MLTLFLLVLAFLIGCEVDARVIDHLNRKGEKMKKLLLIGFVALMGCTSADLSALGALGHPAQITCYSGGVAVYKGRSTGIVSNEKNSDGFYFTDAATNRLTEVSGMCVFVYD